MIHNNNAIGKPYKNIFNSLEHTVDKKKTLIIGDNLQTDIAGGKNFGIKTVLCLAHLIFL